MTAVLYNTIAGGAPSESDVVAAVEDTEGLCAACSAGRLAGEEFGFMKTALTAKDCGDMVTRAAAHAARPGPVIGVDTSPACGGA